MPQEKGTNKATWALLLFVSDQMQATWILHNNLSRTRTVCAHFLNIIENVVRACISSPILPLPCIPGIPYLVSFRRVGWGPWGGCVWSPGSTSPTQRCGKSPSPWRSRGGRGWNPCTRGAGDGHILRRLRCLLSSAWWEDLFWRIWQLLENGTKEMCGLTAIYV